MTDEPKVQVGDEYLLNDKIIKVTKIHKNGKMKLGDDKRQWTPSGSGMRNTFADQLWHHSSDRLFGYSCAYKATPERIEESKRNLKIRKAKNMLGTLGEWLSKKARESGDDLIELVEDARPIMRKYLAKEPD